MEIGAKCKLDFDSVKALIHLSIYKKTDPKKAARSMAICFLVLFLASAAELIAFGYDPSMLILIIVELLMIALDAWMYFGLPRIRYRSLAKMKDAENDYLFGERSLKIVTKSEAYNGEAEISYSVFVKVYETSAFLFLCQTNDQVFLVDKATITGGSVDDIRNILSLTVKDKYIVCRY